MRPAVVSFILFFALSSHAQIATSDKIEFKQVNATINKKSIVVELARNDSERQLGLMHRTQMGENNGMLFVFEDEAPRSFWMKNTLIPLSIAYLNSDKVVVDIQEMEAMPKSASAPIPTYPSRKPAKYALEMNRGWFKKNHIEVCPEKAKPTCIPHRLDVSLPK